MKRNSKKGVLFGTTALAVAVLGVAVISQSAANGGLFAYRLSAVNVTSGTITFDGANAVTSGTTNTITATTQSGATIICKTFNNDSTQSSGYVGALKTDSVVKFYEADGVTEYTFEDLDILRFYTPSTSHYLGYKIDATYANGTLFSSTYSRKQASSLSGGGYGRGVDFSNYPNVSNIKATWKINISEVTLISQIKIVYNCNSKSLTGVEIAQAPAKTSYFVGESFDPTDMIFNALYSNGTSVATTSYSISPATLSLSDTSVTISFGGYSANQSITVSENTYTGTYLYTSGSASYSIVLNADFTGLYNYVNTAYSYDYKMHFTYSISGSTITFIKDAQTGDAQNSGGYYNLFTTDADSTYEKQNSATFETSNEKLYIKLYTCASSSRAGSSKSLYKQ